MMLQNWKLVINFQTCQNSVVGFKVQETNNGSKNNKNKPELQVHFLKWH